MTRVFGMVGIVGLLMATPALAQTPTPTPAPQAPRPAVRQQVPPAPGTNWFVGVLTGVQTVANSGPIAGGEFGIRLKKNLQLVVEGGWLEDVVTSSRIDELQTYVTYLGNTQGLPATGKIDAPAWFATVGARYIYTGASIRPYVMAAGGLARVEYRPTFTLNNAFISSNVGQYGITLGKDLLGPGWHPAYTGGAGLVFGDKWYFDLGFRFTRIQTPDHATDVKRLSIGIGRRF